MKDLLAYRFPGQSCEMFLGHFISNDISRNSKGFVISDFLQQKQFIFNVDHNEEDIFNFHFKDEEPIVYSNETYLRIANEVLEEMHLKDVKKVVLSRIKKIDTTIANPFDLFDKLNQAYPGAFVYLVSSSSFGTWLGASPELLLERKVDSAKTIALAGTKLAADQSEWGLKEQQEQMYVTSYLIEALNEIGVSKMKPSVPIEYQAGPVKHLRTEIHFKLNENQEAELIKKIHPTPAVCGVNKSQAKDIITQFETHNRELYCGYLGVIGSDKTSLYVNLRCCQIQKEAVYLYLGGGFTQDSVIENEWEETENKSKTLLNIIQKLQ